MPKSESTLSADDELALFQRLADVFGDFPESTNGQLAKLRAFQWTLAHFTGGMLQQKQTLLEQLQEVEAEIKRQQQKLPKR